MFITCPTCHSPNVGIHYDDNIKLVTMKIKDCNVTINVKDLDRAILFYESIGVKLKNRWGNHFAQLTAPGIVIGLHPSDNDNQIGSSGNVSIGFTTDEFEEVKSDLQKLSIKTTERQEEGGQFLHFSDPDGTALYFIKPKWH
jgi:catechol 2,3-dioxygenase-like lactoylglutathione lyase family enzyme